MWPLQNIVQMQHRVFIIIIIIRIIYFTKAGTNNIIRQQEEWKTENSVDKQCHFMDGTEA